MSEEKRVREEERVRMVIELLEGGGWQGVLYRGLEVRAGTGRMADPADAASWLNDHVEHALAPLTAERVAAAHGFNSNWAAKASYLLEWNGCEPWPITVVDVTPEGHATPRYAVCADYGWAERILCTGCYEQDAEAIAEAIREALGRGGEG